MATLKELIEQHGMRTVKLLGQGFAARLIDGPTQRLLKDRWPQPKPPMRQNPNKGSAAPAEPDENDPMYVLAFSIWVDQMIGLTVGLSIVNAGNGLELGLDGPELPAFPTSPEGLATWKVLLDRVNGLMEMLPKEQVSAAHQLLCEAPDPEGLRKN